MTVEVKPDIPVEGYTGLEIEKEAVAVSDEEIDGKVAQPLIDVDDVGDFLGVLGVRGVVQEVLIGHQVGDTAPEYVRVEVHRHEAGKAVRRTLPQAPKNHMQEWLDACKGGPGTFQGFVSSADIAEVAMVGMVALRYGKPIDWDSQNMKAKGEPGADSLIHLEQRKKWL